MRQRVRIFERNTQFDDSRVAKSPAELNNEAKSCRKAFHICNKIASLNFTYISMLEHCQWNINKWRWWWWWNNAMREVQTGNDRMLLFVEPALKGDDSKSIDQRINIIFSTRDSNIYLSKVLSKISQAAVAPSWVSIIINLLVSCFMLHETLEI